MGGRLQSLEKRMHKEKQLIQSVCYTQEPSKKSADLIVHSTGNHFDVAINVLKNHIQACVKEM